MLRRRERHVRRHGGDPCRRFGVAAGRGAVQLLRLAAQLLEIEMRRELCHDPGASTYT